MVPVLERRLFDGRYVASILFAPIERSIDILQFIDVGARNGNFLLPPSYAARTKITGFEPNSVEYQKLVEGRTDASVYGLKEPPFKERQYHPYAIWSDNEERTLYLTVAPGAVSLMGPADKKMTSNMWRDGDAGKDYFTRHQAIVGEDRVTCMSLDELWASRSGYIDILKLDVEGAELNALRGAKVLLTQQRILLIFSEFLFVPYYQDRVTLGHQQVFLDERGYRLIGINSDHTRYCWGHTAVNAQNDRRLTYAGDAIFVVDPDRNALRTDQKYRLGLACMAMGFNGFGLNLIRESGLVPASDIDMIEAEANRVTMARKAHETWKKVPDYVYHLFRLLGLR